MGIFNAAPAGAFTGADAPSWASAAVNQACARLIINCSFPPNTLTARVNQPVTLNIQASQTPHTFTIDELGVNQTLQDGRILWLLRRLEPEHSNIIARFPATGRLECSEL